MYADHRLLLDCMYIHRGGFITEIKKLLPGSFFYREIKDSLIAFRKVIAFPSLYT